VSQTLELNPVRGTTFISSALPANTRLRWKLLTMATTLAYNDTGKITAVKSFMVQASGIGIN
jgi:hypothetical protein